MQWSVAFPRRGGGALRPRGARNGPRDGGGAAHVVGTSRCCICGHLGSTSNRLEKYHPAYFALRFAVFDAMSACDVFGHHRQFGHARAESVSDYVVPRPRGTSPSGNPYPTSQWAPCPQTTWPPPRPARLSAGFLSPHARLALFVSGHPSADAPCLSSLVMMRGCRQQCSSTRAVFVVFRLCASSHCSLRVLSHSMGRSTCFSVARALGGARRAQM